MDLWEILDMRYIVFPWQVLHHTYFQNILSISAKFKHSAGKMDPYSFTLTKRVYF